MLLANIAIRGYLGCLFGHTQMFVGSSFKVANANLSRRVIFLPYGSALILVSFIKKLHHSQF